MRGRQELAIVVRRQLFLPYCLQCLHANYISDKKLHKEFSNARRHVVLIWCYKKSPFTFSPFVILYELTFENIWQHMDKAQRQFISPDVFDEW